MSFWFSFSPCGIIRSCACAAQQVYYSCWAAYIATPGGSEPEMPKAAAYRLTWLPEREAYELLESHSNHVLPVAPGSREWFAWLAAVPSFTFSGQAGQLTVRQEAGLRGGTYWYACRRTGEKMAKRYLGRTSELTPARLEEIAAQLAEAALRAGQGTLARSASRAEIAAQHVLTSQTAPLAGAMAAREASPPLPQPLHDLQMATKLHMPRLRTRLVHRNHLIEQLQPTFAWGNWFSPEQPGGSIHFRLLE